MEDLPGILGVLTGFGLVVGVPVVAMLLNHQRKMAEFFRGQGLTDVKLVGRMTEKLHKHLAQL